MVVAVGDITRLQVDAIVNAANSSLMGGGGVDGAIHQAGGRAILEACRELRQTKYPQGLPTGEAVITTGGDLPARHVIHTVGPIFGQHRGEEAALLAACYTNSLKLAASHSLQSIAFPAISTGAFGYPFRKPRLFLRKQSSVPGRGSTIERGAAGFLRREGCGGVSQAP